VKFQIAKELQGRRFLRVQTKCAGSGDALFVVPSNCEETLTWKFAKGWTHVETEFSCEDLRPDIVLLNGSEILGAIEVAVHHYVDHTKAEKYRRMGIPWIEVAASPELIDEEHPWTIFQPLPAVSLEGSIPWRCEECWDQWSSHILNNAVDGEVVSWRVVDLYYPSGKAWRTRIDIKRVLDGSVPMAFMVTSSSAEVLTGMLAQNISLDEKSLRDLEESAEEGLY